MRGRANVREAKPFNLSRRFAVAGIICIATISIAAALSLSRLVGDRLLQQDAELSMQFVQSGLGADDPKSPDNSSVIGDSAQLQEMFNRFAQMPDVIRTNIFGTDQIVLWSNDRSLIGRRVGPDPDLEAALAGQLVVNSGETDARGEHKAERDSVGRSAQEFVEFYLPIRAGDPERVVAVGEIYKTPRRLFDLIHTLQVGIWIGAAIAVGELGTAVAHGIRNPLAAIRSSAELLLEPLPAEVYRQNAHDIIAEADRLDHWVHGFLNFARLPADSIVPVDVGPLLVECFAGYERTAKPKRIELSTDVAADVPEIYADPMLLAQVIGNLVVNSLELNPPPRRVRGTVSCDRSRKCVIVSVRDDGPGMTEQEAARALKPFFTTKRDGLGLGLTLAKRVVERSGGSIAIHSAPAQGAEIRLEFPVRS